MTLGMAIHILHPFHIECHGCKRFDGTTIKTYVDYRSITFTCAHYRNKPNLSNLQLNSAYLHFFSFVLSEATALLL